MQKGEIVIVLAVLLAVTIGVADWYINKEECHCPHYVQSVEQHNANVEALLND